MTPAAGQAGPKVFEETTAIDLPDPAYYFRPSVAVEGDTIIATGHKFENDLDYFAAFLFRRQSDGSWSHVRKLAETSCDTGEIAEDTCGASVSIRNGVAAVSAGLLHVFLRTSAGEWVAAPSEGGAGPGGIAVGTGAVVTTAPTGCYRDTEVFRRSAAGLWTSAITFPGEISNCDTWGARGVDVDMSAGNRILLGTGSADSGRALIFEPVSGTWMQTAALASPIGDQEFAGSVALDDTRAFLSGPAHRLIHVFKRDAAGWTHTADIVPPDSAHRGGAGSLRVRDLLVAVSGGSYRGASLFEETSSGAYEEVAKLAASDSQPLWGADAYVDESFARVVLSQSTRLTVFDIDDRGTTPAPQQHDFEQGNAAGWVPIAGSSFAVVTSGGSKIYRQSSTAGDAGSFLVGEDLENQAIEADVKPTAFNGADRWVGLAVRRTDANNSYYLTLRQSNVLELKRIVNGSFVTLASAPVAVVLNRTYRLRLEAVGTLIRAYLDGRLVLEKRDAALSHGHRGVRTYKASADFDNVIASHDPHLTLLEHRTPFVMQGRWELAAGAWSFTQVNDQQRLVQQDLSGDARAVTLVDARDQVVQVKASATSFAAGTGSRWFGVFARYADAGNYYYVTVRKDNTISLRKLVNGAIQVLDTAPLTVSVGTPYTLRLEAIGSSLRAYVNGKLVLEASDASHASGRYGLVTYKAAATYDDFVAWQP